MAPSREQQLAPQSFRVVSPWQPSAGCREWISRQCQGQFLTLTPTLAGLRRVCALVGKGSSQASEALTPPTASGFFSGFTLFMGKNGNARLHSRLSRVCKKSQHRPSGPLVRKAPTQPGVGVRDRHGISSLLHSGHLGAFLLAQQPCGFSLQPSPGSRRPRSCAPPDVCPQYMFTDQLSFPEMNR